jgi:GAF domain-containing protein
MRLTPERLHTWLARPQATNRDALVLGVGGGILTAVVLYAGGAVLDAADVIDWSTHVALWAVAAGGAIAVGVGMILGSRLVGPRSELERDIEAYETYAEHVRDALADLRRAVAGQLANFSVRDFIETGVFQTAHSLLTRQRDRGDVRFSILHHDGTDLVMADSTGLFPALGHSADARQNYRLPIRDSFSALALTTGRPHASNQLSTDDRFKSHPRSRPGREYESIVSIPIWKDGEVDGVLNVIAERQDAFSSVDQTYLGLLGSVIDVARSF